MDGCFRPRAEAVTRWSIQQVPTPASSTKAHLSSVSCASPTACTSVGSYTDAANHPAALAERWNGKRWSIQNIPRPAGATHSNLVSVSR